MVYQEIHEIKINGREVKPRTELKIKGERVRFRFVKLVRKPSTEWIDVWGGPSGREQMRSFRVDRVVRVHSKNKTGANLLAERRAA